MPYNPIIDEAVIIRSPRPYRSGIQRGDVFAWEPDLPYCRELVIVVRVEDDQVYSENLRDGRANCNDESRFREACYATLYRPMTPPSEMPLCVAAPAGLFKR